MYAHALCMPWGTCHHQQDKETHSVTGNLDLKYVPVNRNGQSYLLKIHVVMAKVMKRGSPKTWRNVMAKELDGRINVPASLLYQTGPSSH